MSDRDSIALWGNLVITHVWGATCYAEPGVFPASLTALSLLTAVAILWRTKR